MPIRDWFLGLFDRAPKRDTSLAVSGAVRASMSHVIILDGTMSSLKEGYETNAGQLLKLLQDEVGLDMSLYYEAGLQWRDWRSGLDVMTGRGLNRQIRRAYGVLASRYRPGDRIYLIGYSRGAYGVRSLAGVLERVGLLTPEFATVRHIRQAYRLYQRRADADVINAFAQAHCHKDVGIEAVAVWDTVKALGLWLPLIWRWSAEQHEFHNHKLGHHVHNGFHALARDENRVAYTPILWETQPDWEGQLHQVWFRGAHGDIGGQLSGDMAARPLANIPFVWLLTQLQQVGLPLPAGWSTAYPQDETAPSVGNWRGFGIFFLARRRRVIGQDPSESLHPSSLQDQDPQKGTNSAV